MTTDSATGPQSALVTDTGLDAVTGAFSYSGRALASALTDSGRQVRTLTGHPNRATGESPIEIRPLDFDDQIGLVASLEGVTTLYNTYWVRFAHQRIDHDMAVENSRTLFQAARRAGVERIVQDVYKRQTRNSCNNLAKTSRGGCVERDWLEGRFGLLQARLTN